MENAYKMGKKMNLTSMQKEAYVMATLETGKVRDGTLLDKIHSEIVFNKKRMSPLLFIMLHNLLKIRDDKFAQILKILREGLNKI